MTDTLTLADVAAKLVDLEGHPGLEHLRRYVPSGVTAQRWSIVEGALGQLWSDLAELEGLSDADELAERLEGMSAAYPEIKTFLDAVDEINTKVAKGLAPALKIFDAAGAEVPEPMVELLATSASDPLSLTVDEIERRISEIADLAALRANWPDAVAATAGCLDALREAGHRAAQTRERATHKVLTGPLPVSTDCEPHLRRELESMFAPDPTTLRELQRRIECAMEHLRQDEALAQGLLDRRAELKGRLRVYGAKVARLGLAEDPDLLSSRGTASGLLAQQPCDLRAATQAVIDYQQMVSAKRETSR